MNKVIEEYWDDCYKIYVVDKDTFDSIIDNVCEQLGDIKILLGNSIEKEYLAYILGVEIQDADYYKITYNSKYMKEVINIKKVEHKL